MSNETGQTSQQTQTENTGTADQSTQQTGQQGSNETTTQTTSDSASTDLGTDAPATELSTDLGTEDTPPEAETPPAPEYFATPEEAAANYEAFTLPEGSTADPELQESFTALAKKLGLNQKGAQELVNYKTEIDKQAVKAWGDHLTVLKNVAKADPEIGGANYDKAIGLGRQVISNFGGTPAQQAELRKVMNNYGVGAHPAMIRFFRNVGLATGETPTGGNGGSGGSVEKPLHELFYGADRSQQGT
jgi:hypothetical protein